jgi:hypothetical protein
MPLQMRGRGDDPVGKIGNLIARDGCHVRGNVLIYRYVFEDRLRVGDGGLNVSQRGGPEFCPSQSGRPSLPRLWRIADVIAVSDRGIYEGGSGTPRARIGEEVPECSVGIGDSDDPSEIGTRKIREHLGAILVDLLG